MKILYVCKNGFSPVKIYRGEGVLNRLKKLDPTVEVVYPGREPWVDLLGADLVYFMRCTFDEEVKLAEDALMMGVPIWYDIDDDVFNLPAPNPASQQMTQHRADNVVWFLKNAQAVTVSTNYMKDIVVKHRGHDLGVTVVPNALDDYAFPYYDMYPGEDAESIQKNMGWRGGVTHQGDILEFAGGFWEFLEKTKAGLHFEGYDPWYLAKGLPWVPTKADYTNRVYFKPYRDYYGYMINHRELQPPWAQAVPLIDNSFNRAKSNIAALEAFFAGAVIVAPLGWEEWEPFEGCFYHGPEDFAKAMVNAIEVPAIERESIWRRNLQIIQKRYILSVTNQARLAVAKGLTGGKP